LTKLPIIICSHHKSGSSYSVKTFSQIAKEFEDKLWMKFYEPDNDSLEWTMCIHQHGRVDDLLLSRNFNGWHCVRHPKALIYSAMLYHQKCKEPWVDIPLNTFSSHTFWSTSNGRIYNKIKNPAVPLEEKKTLMNSIHDGKKPKNLVEFESSYDLNGKSYKEFLSTLKLISDKLLFEMRAYSRGVINDMLNFPNDKRFFLIKLEDISGDPKMKSLEESLIHLDYKGVELIKALEIASKNCLWKTGKDAIKGHSTTGMSDEWKDLFTGEVEKEYRKIFGWAEEALGYR
jgi:hypothetical protein